MKARWSLQLPCGHLEERPAKREEGLVGVRTYSAPPGMVRCFTCGKVGPKVRYVSAILRDGRRIVVVLRARSRKIAGVKA